MIHNEITKLAKLLVPENMELDAISIEMKSKQIKGSLIEEEK